MMDLSLLQEILVNTKNGIQLEKKPLVGLAALDPLTRIYNREFFDSQLDAEWKTALAARGKLTLFLMDIDDFHLLCKTSHQPSVDYALLKIAKTLKLLFRRSSDFVCRFQDNQFALLTVRMDEADCAKYAETICDRVRKLRVVNPESSLGFLTISVGYATYKPKKENTQQRLIDAALLSLQHTKQLKHNRSVSNEVSFI
ncbi:MAG TPA: GGDEF domain-containing protein [Methylotenera sp.]|nr:GGDEF domain-containing protein [Methylotenera sp.]